MLDAASQMTVAAMVAVTLLLWLGGSVRLALVGAALLGNWLACTLWVYASGDYYAWYVFLPVDALTAWYVLRPPSTYTQVVIGAIGVAQVLWHGAYALNPHIAPTYLTALDLLGRAQLAALATGGGYGLAGRWTRRVRRSDNGGMALGKSSSRMEGGS